MPSGKAQESRAFQSPSRYIQGPGEIKKLPQFAKNYGNTVLAIGINQGGGGFSIFEDSKNPDVAWDFMAYMLEAEQNSYWNEMTGAFPINIEAYDDQWISEMQPLSELAKVFQAEDTYVVSSPFYFSNYNDIFSNLHVGLQEVALGEKDAADYLNGWADAMEAAYAEYLAK